MLKEIHWLKNFKLSSKITFGYAALIVFMLGISLIAILQMNNSADSFSHYRDLARETNLSGELQANMLMVRMNVKDFIISSSEKDLEEYKSYWEKVDQFLQTAHQQVNDPEREKKIDLIDEKLRKYAETFAQVVELQQQRNREFTKGMLEVGPPIEQALTKILTSARRDNDMTAAYYASLATRNLLLARLYAQKFMETNQQSSVDRVAQEFSSMEKYLKILDRELQNPERRRLLKVVETKSSSYQDSFKIVVASVFKRNKLISGTLDQIGPLVASETESLKLAVKTVQDTLGPKVEAETQNAQLIITIISVVAILLGILLGFFIISSVLIQLGADPGIIVKIIDQVATGDFTYAFESEKALSGVYANIKVMNDKLRRTFGKITDVVDALASSSTELSTISNQMASSAEQTSTKSNSVATASEEMSTNMNSVAAAIEQASTNTNSVASGTQEMSTAINDLTGNAENASRITEKAVQQAENVSRQVGELGQSADEVGTVTETINAISEKTNLLALNATIEAARAGDAGKGFAVVATEIKELAKGTANSTREIKTKIEAIQTSTDSAVIEIKEITGVIKNVNELVSSISYSMKEQSGITEEIASNVTQIAEGIDETSSNINQSSSVAKEIAADIGEVNAAAGDITSSSEQVKISAEELNKFSNELKEMVDSFKI